MDRAPDRARLTATVRVAARGGGAAAGVVCLLLLGAAGCRCSSPRPNAPPPADCAPAAVVGTDTAAPSSSPASAPATTEIERQVEGYARGHGDLAALYARLLEPHQARLWGDARTPPLAEIRLAYHERLRFLHSCRAIRDASPVRCRPLAALGPGPEQWCDGHLLLYRTLLRPILLEGRCDQGAIRRAARPGEAPPKGVLELCAAVSQRRPAGCERLAGDLRGLCLALVHDDVGRCTDTAPRPGRAGPRPDGDCRHFFHAAKALAAGDPGRLAPDADSSAYVGSMLGQQGACEDRFLETMRPLLRRYGGPAPRGSPPP